jgi:signal transduction histidine kinase
VGDLEQRFLDRVEQVLFIGAALAVVSMLVVGALLSRRLNAPRHTPPNGSVTVTATRVVRALDIAVADTGEGIAPDDLSHVFERFWRVDPARSRGDDEAPLGSGTGLGLAVAQSLVEALGGRIGVESAPEEGSVFRVTLPLAQRAVPPISRSPQAPRARGC